MYGGRVFPEQKHRDADENGVERTEKGFGIDRVGNLTRVEGSAYSRPKNSQNSHSRNVLYAA